LYLVDFMVILFGNPTPLAGDACDSAKFSLAKTAFMDDFGV
jgi:hypothetical protein